MPTKLNPELNYLPLTFASTIIALILGFLLLGLATDFGRSFTTEGYRRHQIARHPAEVPNLSLVDSSGRKEQLKDAITRDGRFVLLNFFYSSCKTICRSQATIFDSLQEKIKSRHLQDKVRLVSVSFDPDHDDLNAINKYASSINADSTVWSILTLQKKEDLSLLLNHFGIYVITIPPFNDLDHNVSLHLVDPQGQLIKIVSLEDADELFTLVNKKIEHDSLQ